jgi:hypothetical protein
MIAKPICSCATASVSQLLVTPKRAKVDQLIIINSAAIGDFLIFPSLARRSFNEGGLLHPSVAEASQSEQK